MVNELTSNVVFYAFAAMALVTAVLVVARANPVASAVSLALCFASAAGVMFQMDAQFLGIIQILVYTGAIMVLILFVVMLLNLKEEARNFVRPLPVIAALVIAAAFMVQLCGVTLAIAGPGENVHPSESLDTAAGQARQGIHSLPSSFDAAYPSVGQAPASMFPEIELTRCAYPAESSVADSVRQGQFPDASLLGYRLFSKYNKELMVLALVLLAAAVGSVVLTRKPTHSPLN